MSRNLYPVILGLAGLAVSLPASAHNGMLPYCHGAIDCGMGGAGVAQAHDATSTALNPALAGQMNGEAVLNAGWFHTDRTMNAQGGMADGTVGTQNSQLTDYPDGSVAANFRLNPQWALGTVFYSGGGGETKYAKRRTSVAGTGAAGDFDNSVRIRKANWATSLAWTPSAEQSYGASVILGWQDMRSNMLTTGMAPTAGKHEVDDAFGWGMRFGGAWNLGELGVGAFYQTPIWFQRFDKYKDLFVGPIDEPAQFGLGLAWHIAPDVDLLGDFKTIMWDDVRAIGTQPPEGGFGWTMQPVLALGAQWRLNPTWTVRAGWNYGPSPIADDKTFANAMFPAINEHHLTTGATFNVNQSWSVSGSAYWSPENSQKDPGTGDNFSQNGKGTTITHEQYGGLLGLRWKF
jgi:long-chain fatty acid transport protein